jgi:membrane-bound lytic murein transglycosylase D
MSPWRRLLACGAALVLGACAATPPLAVPEPAPAAAAPAPAPAPAPAAEPVATAELPVAAAVALADAQAQSNDSGPAIEAPVDPLRPDTPVDLNDRTARGDLWQRVRAGFGVADVDGPLVRKWEQYYASRPDYVQRMTERGSRYLFHIVEQVSARGLPSELALLPFIESAFNPEAMSTARASGMWQFMPATGREFELRQNVFRDDRRDVLASTEAALDYLTRLNGSFGDWHLALAAYNWGPGNVRSAVRRNEARGRPAGYAQLDMPLETRDYVPKLQAVKNIVTDPQRFGLALPALENHPYFLAVPLTRDMDVELAAKLAGLTSAQFKSLNPQLNKPVILAAGTPQILLPYDNANEFVNAVAHHKGPLASWTAWLAPQSMSTAEAARTVGMDEDELRELNAIPPRMRVLAGSTLLVPRGRHREADVSEKLAHNATLQLAADAPPPRRVAFKVGRKGDSVGAVARRYGVAAAQVAQWNKVTMTSKFTPGTTVSVYVAAGKARAGDPVVRVVKSKAAPAKATRTQPTRAARAGKPVRVARDDDERTSTRRR